MARPTYSAPALVAMLGCGIYLGFILGAMITDKGRDRQAREDRLRQRTEKLEREVFKDQVHDIAPMPVRIVNP